MKYLEPRCFNPYPAIAGYAVPYLWGTLGIAYRKDAVKDAITSWKQLYQPAEYLRGKIIMIKDSRETVGMALKALGYSINSTVENELKEAEQLLRAQKPFVKAYSYVAVTEESALVTGEASMAVVYNGDAVTLHELSSDIAFVIPQEGTGLWVDYLLVMRSSQQQELAKDFINFLHEPRNAARLAQYVNYATPNIAALALLPREYLDNTAIFPPKSVLEKSEFVLELPPRVQRKRNNIFTRLIN
jgi:spermidine/putrescine transport system substrate-binding protein